jgi:conjugal transfer mating pair stabilization protein TraN
MRSAVALLLLALAATAHAQVQLCAADLDGDGDVAETEQAICTDTPTGPFCPLQPMTCGIVTNPDGTISYACPSAPAGSCQQDGAGGVTCSPHACFVRSQVPAEGEEAPDTGPTNDGPRDANNACIGELQIFAGTSTRCRKSGVETGFQNCCKKRDDVIEEDQGKRDGGVGKKLEVLKAMHIAAGIAVAAGPGPANAYLRMTLSPNTIRAAATSNVMTEMLAQRCDKRDMEMALLKDGGNCVALGSYCAERWPLVGCVQRAETACCFNSKLARIIQEQGRAQLPAMGGFGDPREPNCRGFRPEEFQAIDFSKIDLSEYFDELTPRAQSIIEGEIRSRVEARP